MKSSPSTEKENYLLTKHILTILHQHDTHTHTGQCLAVHNLLLVYDHAVLIFHDTRLWLVSQTVYIMSISAPPCQMCPGNTQCCACTMRHMHMLIHNPLLINNPLIK